MELISNLIEPQFHADQYDRSLTALEHSNGQALHFCTPGRKFPVSAYSVYTLKLMMWTKEIITYIVSTGTM